MSTATCKSVRRDLDEAAHGELLSASAREHLAQCAECATAQQQDIRLRGILSNLGTVEAPGDFDFRLRARLATERAAAETKLSFAGLSLGLRSAALASLFLVFGTVMFFSFRDTNNPTTPVATVQPPAAESVPTPNISAPGSVGSKIGETPVDNPAAHVMPRKPKTSMVASASSHSRDLGSRPARVLRPSDLNARADFKLDGARKPMKVSLDDGSGTPRTISLAPVSFGSQRVLSQNSSPLMASARGSW